MKKNLKLKEQLQAIMTEHLKTKGFPNMKKQAILKELKPMWEKLEASGLLQEGMTFEAFSEYAQFEYEKSQFEDIFNGLMGGRRK